MRTFYTFMSLFILVCLSTNSEAKPKGSSIVVGCVVVEVSGTYPKTPGPVIRKQEVRIACTYRDKKGREKETYFDTKTDAEGYFKIERVPAGVYVLKAVDFCFERASRITLASKFGRNSFGEKGRYWGMMNGMLMDNVRHLLSDNIEGETKEGVIDLGIHFIQIQAEKSAGESVMGKSSPDGKPPWLRENMMDRGTAVDLFILKDAVFEEMANVTAAKSGIIYNKVAPTVYFGLN